MELDYSLIDGVHENVDSLEIVLRINKVCNQKCLFCFVDINVKKVFSFYDVKKQIEFLKEKYKGKKLEFVITGGEPTINPDFIKIIDYLYKNGDYIRIQTNAVFFGRIDNYLKIEKYLDKLDFFISFHSHISKVYDFITQSKSQFDLALKGIRNLYNLGNVEINIVVNSLNIKYLKDYFVFIGKVFSESKEKRLNISMLTNISKYKQSTKMLVKYSDLVEIINSSEEIIKKYNIIIADSFGAPCDFPFCIGKKLFYFKDKIYTKSREINDRTKLKVCKICKYNDYCNGVLKLYLEKYGEKEFIPIRK